MKRQLPIVLFLFLLTLVSWDSFAQTQIITTPGSGTFTVPSGVTSITVEVWGAGGRGGSRGVGNNSAAGGGGGAYSRSTLTASPGQIISYFTGFGATSITKPNADSTWFMNNTTLLASGGESVQDNEEIGANGGLASNGFGDFRNSGGRGANRVDSNNGGGGGSSAGIVEDGNYLNSTNSSTGAPTPIGGGAGGNGATSPGPGIDGFFPGGGGGGARRQGSSIPIQPGGSGGNGQIRISYIALTSATGTDDQFVCDGDPITEITYSFTPGSTLSVDNLPDGLTANQNTAAGTLSITGTPLFGGTYTINATPSYLSSIPVILKKEGTVAIIPVPDIDPMFETVCNGEEFTVLPIDGTNGFIPDVTTYSWEVPSLPSGLTGGAAGSGNEITGTLTNSTSSALDAIYTVTPTHNGCPGPDFTVTVTVDP
ncbi:MAG: PKD-like domain-containing protein, partial [Bacteroidota bacterium]